MPLDDKPQTWASATKMLRQAAAKGDIGDEALFGDDPLSPKKQKPLDYLEHFKNDDVTEEGHNTGASARKARKFHEGAAAKQGYRVIPGNAASGYTERKVRAAVDAMDSKMGGTVARGPIAAPVGYPLRHRDLMARKATGPGVGPIKSAALDPKKPSGMGLPSKRR